MPPGIVDVPEHRVALLLRDRCAARLLRRCSEEPAAQAHERQYAHRLPPALTSLTQLWRVTVTVSEGCKLFCQPWRKMERTRAGNDPCNQLGIPFVEQLILVLWIPAITVSEEVIHPKLRLGYAGIYFDLLSRCLPRRLFIATCSEIIAGACSRSDDPGRLRGWTGLARFQSRGT